MKQDRLRELRGASIIFLLAVVFAGLVNIYLLFQFRQTQQSYLAGQVSNVVELLNALPPTDDTYRLVSQGFGLARLVITDSAGRFVFDTFLQQGIFEEINNVEAARLLRGEILATQDGYAAMVVDRTGLYRFAFIYLDMSVHNNISLLARWQLVYLVISLVFIAGLGVLLVWRALRPINAVLDRITDLGISTREEDFLRQSFDEMIQRLRKKEEEIQRLASLIAHEFRNSLAAISGLVRSKRKSRNALVLIDKELGLMENLIKHIIDFTRPLKLNVTSLDTNQLIEDLISDLRLPRGVRVRKSLNPDLPPVKGDWALLTRAFGNIIKNALEAKPREYITVKTSAGHNEIIIEIADDGVGIPQEDVEKVFYPFFSSKDGGVGLGLPFVRKVVELHDGTVEIESRVKFGTTVRIRLPVAGGKRA